MIYSNYKSYYGIVDEISYIGSSLSDPPSTIKIEQQTVDLLGNKNVLKSAGRHDPCVVNRAVPIVESMAAIVIMDAILVQRSRKNDSSTLPKDTK